MRVHFIAIGGSEMHYLPTLRENSSSFHETAWVVWHCRSVFSHLRYRRRTHTFLPLDENMADTVAESDEI